MALLENAKSWFASKGVVGGLIATVGSVAAIVGNLFGFTIEGSAVQEVRSAVETIMDNLLALVTAVGGIVAIIGRIFAKKTIA
jgi:hypothetical protein